MLEERLRQGWIAEIEAGIETGRLRRLGGQAALWVREPPRRQYKRPPAMRCRSRYPIGLFNDTVAGLA